MSLPWETIDWRTAWAEYDRQADPASRRLVSSMFAEQAVIGCGSHQRVIGCALFCKSVDSGPIWPQPTRETVHTIMARRGAMTWWEAYAAPLLDNLHRLPYTLPDVDVHVFLAADLGWLVEALALPNVVVHLMEHSSLAAAPGMMWRFLAHDVPGAAEAFCLDVEDDWSWFVRLRRVEEWRRSGLALFRHLHPQDFVPGSGDVTIYRPLVGCHIAYRPQPDFVMRKACEAFVWLTMMGRVSTTLVHPTRGEVQIFGHRWPEYGFDEAFLLRVFYPFWLSRGVSTNFNVLDDSLLFAQDLCATLKAHPDSTVTHHLY